MIIDCTIPTILNTPYVNRPKCIQMQHVHQTCSLLPWHLSLPLNFAYLVTYLAIGLSMGPGVRTARRDTSICTDVHHSFAETGYIPPETFVSLFWVPKGDIFSAGVMFYQILSGKQVACPNSVASLFSVWGVGPKTQKQAVQWYQDDGSV